MRYYFSPAHAFTHPHFFSLPSSSQLQPAVKIWQAGSFGFLPLRYPTGHAIMPINGKSGWAPDFGMPGLSLLRTSCSANELLLPTTQGQGKRAFWGEKRRKPLHFCGGLEFIKTSTGPRALTNTVFFTTTNQCSSGTVPFQFHEAS